MRRILMILALPLMLAACGAERVWSEQHEIDAVAYRDPGPASLTLVTVMNKRSGNGAHTGLIINASQRVIWDPAGTFKHEAIPERNDVIYGASPRVVNYYTDYHARETYDVILQTVDVTPEIAERIKRAVEANGPVAKAQCGTVTSRILRGIPGFDSLRQTPFPKKIRDDFANLPGVRTQFIQDDDPDDNWQNLLDIEL